METWLSGKMVCEQCSAEVSLSAVVVRHDVCRWEAPRYAEADCPYCGSTESVQWEITRRYGEIEQHPIKRERIPVWQRCICGSNAGELKTVSGHRDDCPKSWGVVGGGR